MCLSNFHEFLHKIDLKRAEFRHYLENSGVMDALSRALIKLYDEQTKPHDPVAFVRQNFLRSVESAEDQRIEKIHHNDEIGERTSDVLIQSLKDELINARHEIVILQKALDDMQKST